MSSSSVFKKKTFIDPIVGKFTIVSSCCITVALKSLYLSFLLRSCKSSLLALLLAVAVGIYLLPSPIDPKPHV